MDAVSEVETLVRSYHIADHSGRTIAENPNLSAICTGLGISLEESAVLAGHTAFKTPMEGAMLNYALDTFLSSEYSMDVEAQYAVHSDNTLSVFVREGNRAVYQFRHKSFERLAPRLPILGNIPLITIADSSLAAFIWRGLVVFELSPRQKQVFGACFAGLKSRLETIAEAGMDAVELEASLKSPAVQKLFYTAIGSFARSIVDRNLKCIARTRSRKPVLVQEKQKER